jgi:glycogen operon protein
MLATLLLAQGTPMLLAGDEFGRTQGGNNNAYCQDNEISWVDWSLAERNASLVKFVRGLCALRYKYRVLRRNLFLDGEHVDVLDVRDVSWIHPSGRIMKEQQWDEPDAPCLGMLLDGRAQTTGLRHRGAEATILIIFNSYHEPVSFKLPRFSGSRFWTLLLDTKCQELPEASKAPRVASGAVYPLESRSAVLFVLGTGEHGKPRQSQQSG